MFYANSNSGIIYKVQQTVGPESPRQINFPAKMNKFRARARNFY